MNHDHLQSQLSHKQQSRPNISPHLTDIRALAAHVGPGDDHAPLPRLAELRVVGDELGGFANEDFDDRMSPFLDGQRPFIGDEARTSVVPVLRHLG